MYRVLHVLMCSGHGGDALAAMVVAREQRDRGIDASIVIGAAQHADRFAARCADYGVPARVLRAVPSAAWESGSTSARMRSMTAALYGESGDVLHFHTGELVVGTADAAIVRLLPFTKAVATIQSPRDWGTYDDPDGPITRWRVASNAFGAIICPSVRSTAIQQRAGIAPDRLRIVANPVDHARITRWSPIAARAAVGFDDGQFVVLFASRLDEEKRPVDAVRAFSIAHRTRPHMRLVVAGTGPEEAECRDATRQLALEDAVQFVGHSDDVPKLLRAADAFLLLTRWESFGMAVAEAMSAGVPVVTTEALVDAGVVEAGRTALVVADRAVDEAGAALGALADDRALADRLAEAAGKAAERFDVSHVATALSRIYDETPPNRRATPFRWGAAGRVLGAASLVRLRQHRPPGRVASDLPDHARR